MRTRTERRKCRPHSVIEIPRVGLIETNELVDYRQVSIWLHASAKATLTDWKWISVSSRSRPLIEDGHILTVCLGSQHENERYCHEPASRATSPKPFMVRIDSFAAYHLISRCTARPHPTRRTNTIGMAAIVRPNSAVLVARTTMSSYIAEQRSMLRR